MIRDSRKKTYLFVLIWLKAIGKTSKLSYIAFSVVVENNPLGLQ